MNKRERRKAFKEIADELIGIAGSIDMFLAGHSDCPSPFNDLSYFGSQLQMLCSEEHEAQSKVAKPKQEPT